jgi:hypothetical protein
MADVYNELVVAHQKFSFLQGWLISKLNIVYSTSNGFRGF